MQLVSQGSVNVNIPFHHVWRRAPAPLLAGLLAASSAVALAAYPVSAAPSAPLSAPASQAYAVIRTILLPNDGLAVGAGPDLGDAI